ncbi:MAG: bifunctional phosphopantothenoylcysteine decarboxylase/phosphopantothenate--cysteine ligase CoaBC [Bifidobacteriaceae bacterium]|jgi:phosphopantothenoylcysteine decarboxylase/phosphopantothenate--cysteine ligase|nr:bifunctional phosphopantothenoylcysteine decarboxylase/phosphopantothenate--cysteine ligase CoaBC [Bifidobacteriaceae bacterium]
MALIVVGVAGGIAAYKTPALIRLLTEAGHRVRVAPTEAALRFVGRATFEALSGAPAPTSVFDGAAVVDHVSLAADADVVVVAPATADLLARYAAGRADDLLTATLLATRAPVLVAPSMHSAMLAHPATQANLALLRARGVRLLDSPSGRLTGRDSGPGRMESPENIAAAVERLLGPADLAGRRVLITAGGTREPLDPVRYLGNRSSGKQGLALAEAAARRGALVTLVVANVSEPIPYGVELVSVSTALELEAAVALRAPEADVVVMAAAVADFRPAEAAVAKIKRDRVGSLTLELVANPDILAGLVADRRPGQVIVGFAAETGDEAGAALEHAARKARRKGADLTVVNVVAGGAVFGADTNSVVLLSASAEPVGQAAGSKLDVAEAVFDAVVPRLSAC